VQEFVTCGREFQQYQDEWMKRVEKFEKEGSINIQTIDPQPQVTSGENGGLAE